MGYDPYIWQSRATEEQTTAGWEMAVRIEKIIAVLQHDGYNQQQVEEAICQDGPPEVSGDVLSVCEMEILSA